MGRFLDLAEAALSKSKGSTKETNLTKEGGLNSFISFNSYSGNLEFDARAIVAQALRRTGIDPNAVLAKLAREDLHDIISGAMKPINIVALARSLRDQGELLESPARERIAALPLVDKLRIYGRPWPLKVNGKVVCWLVADEQAKKACNESEPVCTAAEVERLASMPAEAVQAMHKLKARFGGTVTDYEKRRINEKRGSGDE